MFLLLICEELCKLFVEKDIIFDLFRGCLNGSNLGKWDLYFFLELFFLFLVLSFFCFFILFIFRILIFFLGLVVDFYIIFIIEKEYKGVSYSIVIVIYMYFLLLGYVM